MSRFACFQPAWDTLYRVGSKQARSIRHINTNNIGNGFHTSFCAMSTVRAFINKEKISPLMTLRKISDRGGRAAARRPLVLFFPWLYASPSAVDRYCDIYHRRDMDVLSVNCQAKHFLWPSTSHKVAEEVLQYLARNENFSNWEKFFVHGTSIGAFVYTVVMMTMAHDPGKYKTVSDRIRGQVFDSLTMGSLDEMARGISQRAKNRAMQMLIKHGTSAYFSTTKSYTVDFYDKSVEFFKERPLKTPVLILYSLNDPMCSPRAMQDMITHWKEDFQMNLAVKCWEKSTHAAHLSKHPEEYTKALDTFISVVERGDDVLREKSKL